MLVRTVLAVSCSQDGCLTFPSWQSGTKFATRGHGIFSGFGLFEAFRINRV